jgi:hypothetical protein
LNSFVPKAVGVTVRAAHGCVRSVSIGNGVGVDFHRGRRTIAGAICCRAGRWRDLDAISCRISRCTPSSAGTIARRSFSPKTTTLAIAIGLPPQPPNTAVPIAYRELFRTEGDADLADALRAATNGGWALGDARFKQQIVKALDRQGAQPPGCAAAEGPAAGAEAGPAAVLLRPDFR